MGKILKEIFSIVAIMVLSVSPLHAFNSSTFPGTGGGGAGSSFDTQVIFNSGGFSSGDADFTYNSSTNILTVGGIVASAAADPGIVLTPATVTDTRFWLADCENANTTDDDSYMLGTGTTKCSGDFLRYQPSGYSFLHYLSRDGGDVKLSVGNTLTTGSSTDETATFMLRLAGFDASGVRVIKEGDFATSGARDSGIQLMTDLNGTVTPRLHINSDGKTQIRGGSSTAAAAPAVGEYEWFYTVDEGEATYSLSNADATGTTGATTALELAQSSSVYPGVKFVAIREQNYGSVANRDATFKGYVSVNETYTEFMSTLSTLATTFAGTVTSSATGSLGWSKVDAANQACTTTCTAAAVCGFDAGAFVGPADAAADTCLCAGAS